MSNLLKAIYYFVLVRKMKAKNIDFNAGSFNIWDDFKQLGTYSGGIWVMVDFPNYKIGAPVYIGII